MAHGSWPSPPFPFVFGGGLFYDMIPLALPPLVCGECSAMVFWLFRGLESGSTRPEGKVWKLSLLESYLRIDKNACFVDFLHTWYVCIPMNQNENEFYILCPMHSKVYKCSR